MAQWGIISQIQNTFRTHGIEDSAGDATDDANYDNNDDVDVPHGNADYLNGNHEDDIDEIKPRRLKISATSN